MYKSGQKPDLKGRRRKPEGRPVVGGERPSAVVCTSQAASGEGQGQVGEWLEWKFLETLSRVAARVAAKEPGRRSGAGTLAKFLKDCGIHEETDLL